MVPPMRSDAAFKRKWVGAAFAVLLATTACVLLGFWQYSRFETRANEIALMEKNFNQAPIRVNELFDYTSGLPPEKDYLQVELEGRYLDKSAYVRNRTLNSTVGFWQLTLFELENKSVIPVVRGWVPASSTQSAPASAPTVGLEETTIAAWLRPLEPEIPSRSHIPGQLQSISAAELALAFADIKELNYGYYLVLKDELPAGSELINIPKPNENWGPHLSYAFQWWIFAAFFPVGYLVAIRRDLRDQEGVSRRRLAKKESDESQEDDLLDRISTK